MSTITCEAYRAFATDSDSVTGEQQRIELVRHPGVCKECRRWAFDLLRQYIDADAEAVPQGSRWTEISSGRVVVVDRPHGWLWFCYEDDPEKTMRHCDVKAFTCGEFYTKLA